MDTFLQYLQDGAMYFGAIVALATSIQVALEKFVKITPSTKDDEAVAKLGVYLGYLASFVDKVSIWTAKK